MQTRGTVRETADRLSLPEVGLAVLLAFRAEAAAAASHPRRCVVWCGTDRWEICYAVEVHRAVFRAGAVAGGDSDCLRHSMKEVLLRFPAGLCIKGNRPNRALVNRVGSVRFPKQSTV